ncbi:MULTISPECIES: PepSY domain-containing protein [unclassified Chelatococcus]|uniref:PepSY domain-containing protein n=1 Tax=unclassified Chelatococcus TaxID=2638111 RepID=UPI001BCEE6A3|nr:MULTISPECIES: PepSY domain-containing protein [unclassified Chelatococcus]MBS7696825.1 PepSY domain-containing protein [Chelatococcus sp. YT9]MBX3558337.1 PepSY domain-containing protein [Chelatococcus sp.]
MKAVLCALAVTATFTSHALADVPGPDWLPMEQVIAKLKATGYSAIHALEADDGRWEGEGMKNGQVMDFAVDPRSGALLYERLDG